VGYFNIPLSQTDWSRQKINKETSELNVDQTSTEYFIQQLQNTHCSQQPIELSSKYSTF
jgi:hypothetical protein